ncbi:hypothetical protein DL762_002913 [Monosporascus cannonballus]|uniref:Major facilitator superfamily (MFS) profile domain-containing protein n=1 Tax=Monosporascus cannonballus TaxID=155416 RepID=A0ABY0HGK4_9PEZI|nr:hypothetical protein DL762_002913 [Monosporascus cannonballus]
MGSSKAQNDGEGNETPKTKRSWRFWAIILSLSIASLLSALDVSVVSTAMPSMINDLGSSYAYAWIANAYFLTMTAFQPLYGQTANIFGRRSLTLLAMLLFAIGSAVAGAAPNLGALVAGRAIKGIGGGGINILIEIIVADLVPLRERPKYISIIFTAYTVAVVLGPVIGGLFAQRVTWRWIFYLNLPVAGVALALLAVVLKVQYAKDSMRNSFKRVDLAGNALLITSVVSVLLALTWGGVDFPWSSWRTILPLVLGILGIVAFLAIESTILIPEPTMPIRIFSNRTSLGGFALTFIHSMLMYWVSYFLPLYFQAVLGADPITSGVNILPYAAVTLPFAMIAGFGTSKYGRYRPWFFVGFAMFAVAFGLCTRLDGDSSKAYWAGVQCIAAVGAGIMTTTTLPCIQAPLAESDQAVATATWGFVRSFGGVWGVAIPAAVFNSRVNELAATRLTNERTRGLLSNGGAYALAAGGSVRTVTEGDPVLMVQVQSIYVDSLALCWYVALGFALLGFVLSAVVKEVTLRTDLVTEFGLEERYDNRYQKERGDAEGARIAVGDGDAVQG